jgi:DNA-binding GntR family transcriptional regulator
MGIERVRLVDSVPMSFDETYLPLDIGKKVVRNDLRVKQPLFFVLRITAKARLRHRLVTPTCERSTSRSQPSSH